MTPANDNLRLSQSLPWWGVPALLAIGVLSLIVPDRWATSAAKAVIRKSGRFV